MARATRGSKLVAVPAPASIHSAVLQAALDAVVVMDERGIVVEMNGAAEQMFGYAADEAVGQNLAELIIPQAMRERHAQGLARFMATGRARVLGQRLQLSALRRSGEEFPVELAIAEISSSRGGRLFAGYVRDLTERQRDEALRAGQGHALEMIAAGAPIGGTLEAIVRAIEDYAPEALASILLLGADGVHLRHGATGRLPKTFSSAIDGEPIGPRAGSCGTAMHRGEPVITQDIATDPLWANYRPLAQAHGLRACWSTPIIDSGRRVLGSFALYLREPALPTERHLRLIALATHTAAVAIQKARDDAQRAELHRQLQGSEATFRSVFENAAVGMTLTDPDGRLVRCNPALARMLGYGEHELVGKSFSSFTHPDDIEPNRSLYQDLVAGRITHFQLEKRYLRKDGGVIWVDLTVSMPPPATAGERLSIGMMEDISTRKRAQQALQDSEQRYRGILETMTVGFLAIDQRWRITYANARAAEIIGKPLPEFVGKTFAEAFPEAVGSPFEADYRKAMRERVTLRSEQYFEPWDRWFEVRVDPTPEGIGIFFRDISEQRRSDAALKRFRAAMEASGDGIILVDRATLRYVDVNQTLCDLVGYSREEILGMTPMDLFSADRESLERDYDAIIADNDAAASKVEGTYRRKDGSIVPIETRRRALHTEDGWIIVGTARDISERKQAEERIGYLATHDGLTDLPNRNLIQDRIVQAIAHARRAGRQLALLYLDLDRFKVINDGYGHPFGDAVLRVAGERLARLVREGDTVARYGGDEFLILLADLRKAADAYIVAQKVIEGLNSPIEVQGRQVHLSGSIGVSVFPQDGETPEALISNADVAMYRAKELGRNTYQFFTREMSDESLRRVDLETRLRGAAAAGQLQLAYQPKVSLEDGRVTGCEALLRWNLPGTGPVSPARFIPIAEDSGLIVPIGDWVLRTACAQNKAWLDAGLPPLTVAVNISARQFLQQDIVAWVMRTLEETGLPPAQLELELTESLIAQDVEKVIATVNQLKAAGVKLSIDDFGTGYSSLSYLKRFRVDTLKIDQSFVRNMLTEMDDATIVLAVISLAHNLKFKVVAEGVETHEACRFLRLNRCDEIQGYFFSKPVPAAEMEAMLRAGKRLE
jgi:diguanylate cyclase (GGDEF)-like protein/PAS domain S-box-containing protein